MTGGAQGHREHMWKSLGSAEVGMGSTEFDLICLSLEAESHSNPDKP